MTDDEVTGEPRGRPADAEAKGQRYCERHDYWDHCHEADAPCGPCWRDGPAHGDCDCDNTRRVLLSPGAVACTLLNEDGTECEWAASGWTEPALIRMLGEHLLTHAKKEEEALHEPVFMEPEPVDGFHRWIPASERHCACGVKWPCPDADSVWREEKESNGFRRHGILAAIARWARRRRR